MKKVINITIGSVVFAIEQDAYDVLASYLEQIKNNLVNNDDVKEVVEDVEHAIAEKFLALKKSEKTAVTMLDVELVISEMGSPADFGEGESVNTGADDGQHASNGGAQLKKRLYRDSDNAIIAGVAAGLARYFDVDPVVIRLIFVIAIFFNGLGFLAYIILWLVVPIATTTADKYAMRGERVTLKDITERVKKNIQSIEDADLTAARGLWVNLRNVLDKLFNILGAIVRFLIVLARYFIGIAFVVAGALGVAGMVSAYCVLLLSNKILFPAEVQMVLETLQGSVLGALIIVSSFIVALIPLLVLIILGASILVKRNFFTVPKAVTFAVVWIIAMVVAGTTSILQTEQIIQKIDSLEERSHNSNLEKNRAGMAADYLDASYTIDGETVQLTDGYSESEATPGSASKNMTRYFGNELVTDLDGDGDNDVAFILTQETGGSGTFYYAVAALNTVDGYVGSDGYFLGDRIAPQSTDISQNPRHKNVVVFNYAERAEDEPMSTEPSLGKSAYLKLDPETMRWGIVEPNFEGESAHTIY